MADDDVKALKARVTAIRDQHEVRGVVSDLPTAEMPRALAVVVEALRENEEAILAARVRIRELAVEIGRAHSEDARLLAAAHAGGERIARPDNEVRARAARADVVRQHRESEARVRDLLATFERLVSEQSTIWARRLASTWEKRDRDLEDQLDTLVHTLEGRERLRAALAWLAAGRPEQPVLFDRQTKVRVGSRSTFEQIRVGVEQLVDGLRGYVDEASAAAAAEPLVEQVAVREREVIFARRLEQVRAADDKLHAMVESGEVELELAEKVVSGEIALEVAIGRSQLAQLARQS